MARVMTNFVFEKLDLDNDGEISRSELHKAAELMGWHWYEAPVLALLDLMTISAPITKNQFTAYIQQISEDPMGPYGKVLLNSPHFSSAVPSMHNESHLQRFTEINAKTKGTQRPPDENLVSDLLSVLEKTRGVDIADHYNSMLDSLETCRIAADDSALLIIDPQRSFTRGAWMQSIGDGAAADVELISTAFNNCAKILDQMYGGLEIMFTRCPFPPESYDWDDCLAEIIDNKQLYFIKPGNSVLFPAYNGFREWMARCMENRKKTLVIGGCTLNSCVRVSAIDTLTHFKTRDLQVFVDLSICGARTRNFMPSAVYGGMSAVESAIHQMTEAGVRVVRQVEWV
jgi:nicotinamidase-related amidase